MRTPSKTARSFTAVVTPVDRTPCEEPSLRDRQASQRILEAVLFGILGSVAGSVGEAAAGGDPVDARTIWAGIIGGAAGGVAGGIAEIFGADAGLTAVVGAFIGGFVAEALFGTTEFVSTG